MLGRLMRMNVVVVKAVVSSARISVVVFLGRPTMQAIMIQAGTAGFMKMSAVVGIKNCQVVLQVMENIVHRIGKPPSLTDPSIEMP